MSTNILEDLLEIIPFAAEVKRNPRTVRRWIDQPNGLPYTKLGNRTLIHLPTARAWIMSHMRNTRRASAQAASADDSDNQRGRMMNRQQHRATLGRIS